MDIHAVHCMQCTAAGERAMVAAQVYAAGTAHMRRAAHAAWVRQNAQRIHIERAKIRGEVRGIGDRDACWSLSHGGGWRAKLSGEGVGVGGYGVAGHWGRRWCRNLKRHDSRNREK